MAEIEWAGVFVLLAAAALYFGLTGIRYWFLFSRPIRSAKMEIRRIRERRERNDWRRELRVLRLSLWLGVSMETARRMCIRAYRE